MWHQTCQDKHLCNPCEAGSWSTPIGQTMHILGPSLSVNDTHLHEVVVVRLMLDDKHNHNFCSNPYSSPLKWRSSHHNENIKPPYSHILATIPFSTRCTCLQFSNVSTKQNKMGLHAPWRSITCNLITLNRIHNVCLKSKWHDEAIARPCAWMTSSWIMCTISIHRPHKSWLLSACMHGLYVWMIEIWYHTYIAIYRCAYIFTEIFGWISENDANMHGIPKTSSFSLIKPNSKKKKKTVVFVYLPSHYP